MTRATKNKARSVLNMIFNQALDGGLIAKNPFNSRNLRIKGKASAATLPYFVENIQFLLAHLSRNLGMVGEPKTEASKRTIALVPQIEKYLCAGPPQHFVLGGERPLSYVQVQNVRQNPAGDGLS